MFVAWASTGNVGISGSFTVPGVAPQWWEAGTIRAPPPTFQITHRQLVEFPHHIRKRLVLRGSLLRCVHSDAWSHPSVEAIPGQAWPEVSPVRLVVHSTVHLVGHPHLSVTAPGLS